MFILQLFWICLLYITSSHVSLLQVFMLSVIRRHPRADYEQYFKNVTLTISLFKLRWHVSTISLANGRVSILDVCKSSVFIMFVYFAAVLFACQYPPSPACVDFGSIQNGIKKHISRGASWLFRLRCERTSSRCAVSFAGRSENDTQKTASFPDWYDVDRGTNTPLLRVYTE